MNRTLDLHTVVNERSTELVALLQDLVRRSEHGHGAVQDFVAERLSAAGAEVQRVRYLPLDVSVGYEIGTPTDLVGESEYVVGSFGRGDDGLLWFAHSDSERVDPTGWTRPLFAGEIEGGRLYGWGVGDDLVGVALLLALAGVHAAHPFLGSRRMMLASVPSKRRAQAVIHAMDNGFVGAGSVYLHPAESGSGLREIKAVASGILRFQLRVQGRPPSTSEPGHTVFLHTGVDPVLVSASIIQELAELNRVRGARLHYGPVHDAIGRSTNIHVSHVEAGRREKLGQVPPFVDLFGSITFPPTEPMQAVQAEVEETIDRMAAGHAWLADHRPELTWLVGISGSATAPDSPIYRLTHAAITAVTGVEPHVNPLHAGSDIRNPILHKGMPAVGIGPLVGDLTVSGRRDEWVDVADYLRAVEVVCRIAHDWSAA